MKRVEHAAHALHGRPVIFIALIAGDLRFMHTQALRQLPLGDPFPYAADRRRSGL